MTLTCRPSSYYPPCQFQSCHFWHVSSMEDLSQPSSSKEASTESSHDKDKDADLDEIIDKMLEIQASNTTARNQVKVEPPSCDAFDSGGTANMSSNDNHQFQQAAPYIRQYEQQNQGDGFGYDGAYVTPATASNFAAGASTNTPASYFGHDDGHQPLQQHHLQQQQHDHMLSYQPQIAYFAAAGAYYPAPNPQAAYGNIVAGNFVMTTPTASNQYGQFPDSPTLLPPTPNTHMLQGRKVSPDIQRLIGGRSQVTRAHSSPDMVPSLPLAHASPPTAHLPLSHTSSSSVLPPNFMASLGHHSWSLEAVSQGGMSSLGGSMAGSESLDDPLSPLGSNASRISVSRKNSDQTSPSPSSQPLSPLCTTPGSAFPPSCFSAITEGMRHHSSELLYLSPGSSRALSAAQGEQKLCIVCGDCAACQHYGVRTCEGCKGFFKRTVQKNAQYVCMGNRDCPIDKRRRNRCQYCRFQKCIQVGMVKEVVRHGSLRGRRGRLPSKTKVHTNDDALGSPVPLITSLTRAYEMTRTSDSDVEQAWVTSPDQECLSNEKMLSLIGDSYDAIRCWAEKVPGYNDIAVNDQETLMAHTFFHVLSLRLAYRSMHVTGEEALVFDGGRLIRVGCMPEVWQSWGRAVLKESVYYKECLQIDLSAFSSLLVFMLLHPEHLQLENVGVVDQLRSTVVNALKDHCTSSFAAHRKAQYFANLFARVAETQPIASAAQSTLISVRKWGVPVPHQLDMLLHIIDHNQ